MRYKVRNAKSSSVSFDIERPNMKPEGIHLSSKHDVRNRETRLLKEREFQSPEIQKLISLGMLRYTEYPEPGPQKSEPKSRDRGSKKQGSKAKEKSTDADEPTILTEE